MTFPKTALSTLLVDLREELARDLEVAKQSAPLARREAELDAALVDLDGQLLRAEAAGVLVLVGPTGAGKSTLLNALVGREVAKEGEMRPTTSHPTVHAPEDADLSALLDHLPSGEARVVRYSEGASGPYAGHVLVDAPDLNSAAREHRQIVASLAERADVLVVVLKAESVVEESALSFLDAFRGRRELVLVLGRADEWIEAARRDLVAQIAQVAKARFGLADARVFALSAREAREGRQSADYRAFLQHIESLGARGALGRVRRHNALGVVERLAETVRGAVPDGGKAIEAAAQEQAAAMVEWAEAAAEEVAHRAQLRAGELAQQLALEAGRGWNGPMGWMLRAGSLAAVGLGAGALVARRNPWLAAGLAAGGAVAGKAQGAYLRRRASEGGGLLPEVGELEASLSERLGAARLALAREIAPRFQGQVAVPSAGELYPQLEQAVEESWSRLAHRDLPEAAAALRSLPLRLSLDALPYALMAWMVWLAAEGFWRGDYVGLDFLLNGGFLLLALLLFLRLLLTRLFSSRARRLGAAASNRAATRLVQLARETTAGPTSVAQSLSRALNRLIALPSRWQSRLRAS